MDNCFFFTTQNSLDYSTGAYYLLWKNFLYLVFDKLIKHPNIEGGYRNSQHPSVLPSFCPSVQKESPLIPTIFHRSLPNFYSMFISLKNMQFHKKLPKIVAVATVFLFYLSGISAYVCSLHESMKVPSCQTFTISS